MIDEAVAAVEKVDEPNWDPEIKDRFWVTRIPQGDKGYLCKRNGRVSVRYDRPNCDMARPYRKGQWVPARDQLAFTRQQAVMVAYAADRELCLLLGQHRLHDRSWATLTEAQRRSWLERGPKSHPMRAQMYEYIVGLVLTGHQEA